MRILLLAPHAYYIERGTPIDVDIMLRALSERGERVDAVVYHEGEDRHYPGVTIHRAPAPRWVRNVPPGFSWKKLLCDLSLARVAWRLARQNAYDVIHAGEESVFIALLLRRLLGRPYVYDMDSSIAQQMVEKMPWLKPVAGLLDWFEAQAIRHCLAAAPVCPALADLARARGAPHVVTMHDISQLDPDPPMEGVRCLRTELGLEGPLVMYVGNLEPYQGVDLLLESFARVRARSVEASLVIAGGVEADRQHYQRMAERLGIEDRTHLIGTWPLGELASLLTQADVLTAPRLRGINTPMKIFPYLHSGRAVLVTDLPTHSQVLDPSVAMLAPPEAEGFAEAMIRLIEDPALQARLGQAGRRLVEQNHTYPAHRRRVNELYDHLLEAVRGQRAAVA